MSDGAFYTRSTIAAIDKQLKKMFDKYKVTPIHLDELCTVVVSRKTGKAIRNMCRKGLVKDGLMSLLKPSRRKACRKTR